MVSLREIRMHIQLSGVRGALRVLQYTRARAALDQAYEARRAAHPDSSPQSPGQLTNHTAHPHGADLTFENARLEVRFLAADLLRLTWTPGNPPVPYAIAKTEWPGCVTTCTGTPQSGLNCATNALTLRISPTGALTFLAADGGVLRQVDAPTYRHTMEGAAWSDHAVLRPEEGLFGLGERAGRLDWRGQTHRLWNSDPGGAYQPGHDPIYMPMPVFLGMHHNGAYLVFYENTYPAQFSSVDGLRAAFEGGQLRSYFIPGPAPRAIERFTELTGRPPLPPRWALGYHQSRWSYMNAAEVRQLARGFRARDLPLSAIHLDIDYMHGYRVFTVDNQRFPDLKALTDELHEQGIRTVTILDPGVKKDPGYDVYSQGLQRQVFAKTPTGEVMHGIVWPGWSAFPDFTNPETRAWWAGYYPRLLDLGVDGIWHDMNEPTSFAAAGGPYLPKDLQHNLEGQGGNHLQAHNVYAHQMARAGFDGLQAARPLHRPWIVTRSGWVGVSRYAWNWTGDAFTSWESLRMVAAIVLSTGLSGQPFNGPDIGGFSGDPSPELYIRYFQMAAFLPFFRTHSAFTTPRREPWSYGEPYTRIAREFLTLRYKLLPYFYTLAWEASQTGHPLVRPLWWLDPSDDRLWGRDDVFLLGHALLVACLLDESGTRREVTLPKGGWYSLWDDTLYEGPTSVEIETGLERIPVLARAGSILPMESGPTLQLHVYAPTSPETAAGQAESATGSAADLSLYSDAGEGYGAHRLDHFTLHRDQAGGLLVEWRAQGDFPFPYTQVELVLHGQAPALTWGQSGSPLGG